jgi:tRNA pseudouridine38-40 synthase
MTVAYDGSAYSGFQIQVDRPTIQGELEKALAALTGAPVRVHGAGRTDAGVHAQGQVISFGAAWRHPLADLQRGMNALLPGDIAVRGAAEAPERFHARFSATSREYLYKVCVASVREPLLERYAHRLATRPDWAAMERATALLVGEHDFAAFGQAPSGENTIRIIHRAQWGVSQAPRGCSRLEVGEFRIVANGFLRGMVRRIVGTLIDVGRGALTPDQFGEILQEREIRRASPPAPACGLTLWRVNYQ